ncbi:uncharacterized protein LOC123549883 [Mercenaria mercenaria]|uniref:uncharacterized protein LOC123549883 n=1 Tax=Mercenaria mercenaria TaxID=6596 RepID=UPI00234E382F|nr:uncharacterized protein LOC123549883 [Mercenaria mercenaria]
MTSSTEPSTSREETLTAVPLYVEQEEEISKLKDQLNQKNYECAALESQLKLERFNVNRFSNDDTMIQFYTGFSSYMMFVTFFQCIEPSARNMLSRYYEAGETISLAGRKRSMLLIDEFLMFLCRLRVGLLEQDLSVRFNSTIQTVSQKVVAWANYLYLSLGRIPIYLSREVINANMPQCFKDVYPKTRIIIDCTEIKTQQPSSLVLNSQMYSTYKSACTLKCLLGIAPHGAVTFVSSLFTGCISDVEITRLSGLLDLIEPGDDVMADKGFTIKNLLNEKQATLNIPPFLSSKRQFTQHEIKETEQIAKLRIHIERMNRRIKEYHLFDVPVPLSLLGSANQLWTVACLLSNFKGPIVNAWKSN